MSQTINTQLTEVLGIRYPILLAGMNGVAHSDLVAAVTNAGGLGTIGGLTMSPDMLRKQIHDAKELITDKVNPKFGVDLAIPQIGGSARKTNHDYTGGKLPELVDVMIEEGTSLFVCAVGVPPVWLTDKLHAAGIPVMNMIGHTKHVQKALDAGVDMICAQGSEGGGHTGEIGTSVLLPAVVDACRGKMSPLTGKPIMVIGAGGIYDGRGLASCLAFGCSGVWVGTRFVAATESAANPRYQKALCAAGMTDTTRTLVYSGRPLRTLVTEYVADWEERPQQIKELCDSGVVPFEHDFKYAEKNDGKTDTGDDFSFVKAFPMLMGQASGNIQTVETAQTIVDEMVQGAIEVLTQTTALVGAIPASVVSRSKL